jgi:hypothetical protein
MSKAEDADNMPRTILIPAENLTGFIYCMQLQPKTPMT